MTKQNKRKGFALLEMLAVIAIVGVLVAVVIPMVTGNDVRARAAANAANLRAIQGQVEMAMLENPEDFAEFLEQGYKLQEASDGILGRIYDWIFGDGAAEESRSKYNYLPDLGGYLEIPRSGKQITNVVTAKGLEAPNRSEEIVMTVEDKTIMWVYVTADGAVASYGNWTAEDFADVAEDGYYDGVVTGSGGSGGGKKPVECRSEILDGTHVPGAGCKCPHCGEVAHKDADRTVSLLGLISYDTSSTKHGCSACGENYVFQPEHEFNKGSHNCIYQLYNKDTKKFEPCDEGSECVDQDRSANLGLGELADHKCYMCGGSNDNKWCTDNKSGALDIINSTPDHKCDTCGNVLNNCGDKGYTKVDGENHKCNICTKESGHSFDSSTNQCVCGYSKPTCKLDGCNRTDVQKDEYCAGHQQDKNCNRSISSTGLLARECTGKYRSDPDKDCSKKSEHLKCPYTGCGTTENIQSDKYCSTHKEIGCSKDVKDTTMGYTYLKNCPCSSRNPSFKTCTDHTHYKEETRTCSVGKTEKFWGIPYAAECDSCGNKHQKGDKIEYTVFVQD